jgi:cell division protein FtsI (penicillin-binding protein 3)
MAEPYAPPRWVKFRLCLAAILLGSLLALLAFRAYVLQVREAGHLRSMAEEQYLHDVELPPHRGRILDRNGAELAASAEVDSVYCNPRLFGERAGESARKLASVLHLERKELERRLQSRRYFTWIKRRVAPEEAAAVRELGLPGVQVTREARRYYPNRGLAGTVLGWAGIDGVGQEGLELQYERDLRGARSTVPGLRDALGRAVLTSGLGEATPQRGHDLLTTIDRYIQFRLEHALEKAVLGTHAKAGVAVALDPRNGEILAMASLPSLDPNEPNDRGTKKPEHGIRNRAVTDPFEPGSTMKTFSIAGALEAGLVRTDERWFCENGRYQVGPATIHDAERIGSATTSEVLAKSSNICTAKIAAREGRDRLHEIFLRFGFARPTGVDLPGERAGQLRSAEKMGPVETATISFGQGMTATPLQIAAAYAAIANGGTWYRPHIVRRIFDGEGTIGRELPMEGHRVVTPELAATLRKLLYAVTQKGGTAEKLQLPGYRFGGKTGTAQKVDPVTRHYSTDKWASSFVGFAPLEDPRLVLFVMIDEPTGTHYGSMVAGPVFQETVNDALHWLGVLPSQAVSADENRSMLAPLGAGDIGQQRSKFGEVTGRSEAAELDEDEPRDEPGRRTAENVPDFSGMSIGEALVAAEKVGLHLEVIGSGLATNQSPGPGVVIRSKRSTCKVSFTPPD